MEHGDLYTTWQDKVNSSNISLFLSDMGSKIELFRIGVYVFLPVAVFYFFNNPEFFDDYVTKKQRDFYPPEDKINILPRTKEELEELRLKYLNERRMK